MIGQSAWKKYQKIINTHAHNEFNQDILVWRRESAGGVSMFQEEHRQQFTDIELKVLVGYNTFRTWPITRHSDTGESDNQNMMVLINRHYLSTLGYLTQKGYFNFKPDQDYFIHRGMKYKAEGDTLAAQANDHPLFIQLVLRRDEITTGTDRYNQ